jgi:plastocyanin
MKSTFLNILLLPALFAVSAGAGTITGTIRAEGKPGTDGDSAGGGAYASRKFKFVERVNYSELHDFVVYLEGPVGGKPVVPETPATVESHHVVQKGAVFTPHVLPVVVGTTVEWPNNDDIYHNVFSMSDAKPFDLGLYKHGEPGKRITFDKPGRVDVFCSIHAGMHCIILVLENPYFAVADDAGHYAITNVPPGTYHLTAWHERLPKQSREITVPPDGPLKADFVLSITNLPAY